MSPQLRAVIYCRASEDPTGEGRSVESQEDANRRTVERRGWSLHRVIVDNNRGASRHSVGQRPGYAELRRLVAAHEVDVIVATELSRATRDDADFIALRDLAANAGVLLAYGDRVFDLTRTDDRFSVGLDALLASREADVVRDRVLRGSARSAARGRPPGRLLYGYLREFDSRGAYLRQIEEPHQADVIRELARRVLAGEALYSIAATLNARGEPTPAGKLGWDSTRIRRVITNPAYAALRVHQGRIVGPGDWPAILDEATWQSCVSMATDPDRRSTMRQGTLVWLLTGTLRCGVCGGHVRAIKNRGTPSYLCKASFHVSVGAATLHSFIVPLVLARLAAPDLAGMLTTPTDDIVAAREQVSLLQARLDGFYLEAADGKVSPAGLAAIEARLLPELETARQRARRRADPLIMSVAGPNPAERWDALSVAQQRHVVGGLIDPLILSRATPGSRFHPRRLGQSRWAGDTRTWDELGVFE